MDSIWHSILHGHPDDTLGVTRRVKRPLAGQGDVCVGPDAIYLPLTHPAAVYGMGTAFPRRLRTPEQRGKGEGERKHLRRELPNFHLRLPFTFHFKLGDHLAHPRRAAAAPHAKTRHCFNSIMGHSGSLTMSQPPLTSELCHFHFR